MRVYSMSRQNPAFIPGPTNMPDRLRLCFQRAWTGECENRLIVTAHMLLANLIPLIFDTVPEIYKQLFKSEIENIPVIQVVYASHWNQCSVSGSAGYQMNPATQQTEPFHYIAFHHFFFRIRRFNLNMTSCNTTHRFSHAPAKPTREAFVERFGSIYEHSPWVAERIWQRGVDDNHSVVSKALADTEYLRDLVGYTNNPPAAHWLGSARIAFKFFINHEEDSENCVLHGDAASEAFLSQIVGPRLSRAYDT